jgi:Mn-dependent DtxR family transcriptional regulator
LSPALQDYLEAIRALHAEQGGPGVRVTDIAARLGTRLPTVVRSIARLRGLGLAEQAERGPVRLTPIGSALAAQLAHRHADVLRLLTEVLGLPAEVAEADACVLEHGLSAASAQALHEFLERWDMAVLARTQLAAPGADRTVEAEAFTPHFDLLGSAAGSGGRA